MCQHCEEQDNLQQLGFAIEVLLEELSPQIPRKLTPYETRVNFSETERILNNQIKELNNSIKRIIQLQTEYVEKRVNELAKRNYSAYDLFFTIEVPYKEEYKRLLKEALKKSMVSGISMTINEIGVNNSMRIPASNIEYWAENKASLLVEQSTDNLKHTIIDKLNNNRLFYVR